MSLNQQIYISLQINDAKNNEVNKLINEIQELYCIY